MISLLAKVSSVSLLFAASLAWSAPCNITQANWDINAKGGDPSVRAVIGNPAGDIALTPKADGCLRPHERGTIYWNAQAGTFYILGAIRQKYFALNAERGVLGYPATDETSTPDRIGRYNHFQGGSIYWHPQIGAFEVHGDIRGLWSQIGWEKSLLGYPTTDETKTPDGVGRFNHFQNGSIYWKPALGPHFTLGAIRQYWASRGWERNPALGYPISNELAPKAGSANRYSDFENGVVYWKASNGYTSELTAFPPASRDRESLEAEAQQKIAALLQPYGDQAYIDRAAQIATVDDYVRSGANVENRQIKLSLRVKYKAEFLGIDGLLPDPYTDMDLWVLIRGEKTSSGTNVTLTLTRAHLSTTVPAPTNVAISPETINAKLKDAILNNVMGKPQLLGTVPPALNVLSIKIMPDGGLRTFVEPLS